MNRSVELPLGHPLSASVMALRKGAKNFQFNLQGQSTPPPTALVLRGSAGTMAKDRRMQAVSAARKPCPSLQPFAAGLWHCPETSSCPTLACLPACLQGMHLYFREHPDRGCVGKGKERKRQRRMREQLRWEALSAAEKAAIAVAACPDPCSQAACLREHVLAMAPAVGRLRELEAAWPKRTPMSDSAEALVGDALQTFYCRACDEQESLEECAIEGSPAEAAEAAAASSEVAAAFRATVQDIRFTGVLTRLVGVGGVGGELRGVGGAWLVVGWWETPWELSFGCTHPAQGLLACRRRDAPDVPQHAPLPPPPSPLPCSGPTLARGCRRSQHPGGGR